MRTAPCSSSTASPWNFTRESANTITLDPLELRLAVESGRVCTRSPEKTAADLGTVVPLIQAVPFEYNMAEAESAASNCAGTNIVNTTLNTVCRALCIMKFSTPTQFSVSDNPIPQKGCRSMILWNFSEFFDGYSCL